MTNSTCPYCGEEVLLAAIWGTRNQKWTVLPLEEAGELGDFRVFQNELQEAVDIMSNVVGEFPISARSTAENEEATYRTHRPSHYLEATSSE